MFASNVAACASVALRYLRPPALALVNSANSIRTVGAVAALVPSALKVVTL